MDWLCKGTFLPFLLVFTVGVIVKSATQDTDQPLIPATVEACSGSSAIINCTFQINASYSIVNWYFSETPDHSSESKKIEIHDERYHQEKRETWSSLTIKEVLSNGSGWYFCQVIQHIPQLRQYHSNGSHLIIINSTTGIVQEPNTTTAASTMCVTTPRPSSFESSAWWLWTALTMVCVVLVIVIVTIWNIFCRRRESPVYENTQAYQKDRSPCRSKSVEKDNLTKQRDPQRSHYTSRPKGRQLNS
ncbi:uncharacterized protein LOC108438769 isoform X2 [Pygocentrus nattereri]|uniref:uncharacterized protein LOC108438769 isoform X2 n=1 Tax=Pygocentrus nattereri TaxID=42514 RepID=UPI001890D543|nr:uncharacterized protein LOC108438769 isoform X2 [Pygocentrus nattereri]